jgi:hypothetical protein
VLSQHERRTLAVIEEQLSAEAPDLAQLLARFDQGAPERQRIRHRATWCVVVLGVPLLGVAFALRSADVLFLSAMLLMFVVLHRTLTAVARALIRRRSAHTRIER